MIFFSILQLLVTIFWVLGFGWWGFFFPAFYFFSQSKVGFRVKHAATARALAELGADVNAADTLAASSKPASAGRRRRRREERWMLA